MTIPSSGKKLSVSRSRWDHFSISDGYLPPKNGLVTHVRVSNGNKNLASLGFLQACPFEVHAPGAYPRPRRLGSVFFNSGASRCASVVSSKKVQLHAPDFLTNRKSSVVPRLTPHAGLTGSIALSRPSVETSTRKTGSVLSTPMS